MHRFAAKFMFSAVMVVWFVGCTGSPGPGENTGDDQFDNIDTTDLPDEQVEAIRTAVNATIGLVSAGAGVYPTGDPNSLVTPNSAEQSQCPEVAPSLSPGTISLTLDFGDSCSPLLFPDATMSGAVTGTISTEDSTVSLAFDSFTVDDQTLDGDFTGEFIRESQSTTFDSTFDFTATDAGALNGDAILIVDSSTGSISIPNGTVLVTPTESIPFTMTISSVVAQPVENGNFLPQSGSVTFTLDTQPVPVVILVEFTEETPETGAINYSIDENPNDP